MKAKLILVILIGASLFSCRDKQNQIVPNSFKIQVLDANHGEPVPNSYVRFHGLDTEGFGINYIGVAQLYPDENGYVTSPPEDWDFAQAVAPDYMDNGMIQSYKRDLYEDRKLELYAELEATIRVFDNPELNDYVNCRFIPQGDENLAMNVFVHSVGDDEKVINVRCYEGREYSISVRFYTAEGETEIHPHTMTGVLGGENELIIQY